MEQRLTDISLRLNLGQSLTDDRIMRGLRELPHERAMKLLDDFEINLQQNRQGIRNPAGYLVGMVGRVKKQGEFPSSGVVLHELESMFRSGLLRRADIDVRCLDMLQQLPEDGGLQALAELRTIDCQAVKNMSAFFMSVMKKYTPSSSSGPVGHRGGGGGWEEEHGQGGHVPWPEEGANRGRELHHHIDRQYQQDGGAMGGGGMLFLPAPRTLPAELRYGFGADEYVPEIPRPLEGCSLPPAVQDALEELIERGVLDVDDLDNRIMKELRGFPEHVALRVARDFSNLDKSKNVRSVSGFLMGMVRKHAMLATPGPGQGPGPGPAGGSYHHPPAAAAPVPVQVRDVRDGFPAGGLSGPFPPDMRHPKGARSGYDNGGRERSRDRSRERSRERDVGRERSWERERERERERGRGGGAPPARVEGAAGMSLVEAEVASLVGQGLLRHDDVDDRVREFLAAQQGWVVTKALGDFSAKDMSRINNKSNFLKGIVRKLLEMEGGGGGGGGGGKGQPQPGFFPPHQQHQHQHQQYPPYQQQFQHSHMHPSQPPAYVDPYAHHGGGGKGGGKGGGMAGRGGGRY